MSYQTAGFEAMCGASPSQAKDWLGLALFGGIFAAVGGVFLLSDPKDIHTRTTTRIGPVSWYDDSYGRSGVSFHLDNF